MPENNLITKAMRREYSLRRFAIRAQKDSCLHNDVEYFLARHDTSLDVLVCKLLNKDFTLLRLNDPNYPM